MLLAGSGEVLTAIRSEAFTPWLSSAVVPPIAPAATEPSELGSWLASSAATVAPAIGRITVWTASQAVSMYGILSATASSRNSTVAAISTSERSSTGGTASAPPKRPNRPSSSTTAYALIPLAQPLVKTSGMIDMLFLPPAASTRPAAPHRTRRPPVRPAPRCTRRSQDARRGQAVPPRAGPGRI